MDLALPITKIPALRTCLNQAMDLEKEMRVLSQKFQHLEDEAFDCRYHSKEKDKRYDEIYRTSDTLFRDMNQMSESIRDCVKQALGARTTAMLSTTSS
jgi:hypothetical protein